MGFQSSLWLMGASVSHFEQHWARHLPSLSSVCSSLHCSLPPLWVLWETGQWKESVVMVILPWYTIGLEWCCTVCKSGDKHVISSVYTRLTGNGELSARAHVRITRESLNITDSGFHFQKSWCFLLVWSPGIWKLPAQLSVQPTPPGTVSSAQNVRLPSTKVAMA